MPAALTARDLVKSYRARPILDGIELIATAGRRIGCVGENGVGKSTLLRLLAGVEAPDSGTVEAPADLGYLPQEPDFAAGVTVGEVGAAALAPLHRAVRQVETLSAALPDRTQDYVRALEWAQAHQAWDADRRAELARARLGLAGIAADRPVATLSGGQRSRLALALIMTSRPDCVLLDEPTNHLDGDTLSMLEEFLIGLPGVLVVVSHDRVFLDRVCTDIVDLDPTDGRSGIRYGGGFSDYLEQKAAARARWQQTYLDQQATIAQLRRASTASVTSVAHGRGPTDGDKFIYNFKGGNVERTHARRVRNAQRRLDIAERDQVRKPRPPLRFDAPLTGPVGSRRIAVSLRDVEVTGRLLLPRLDVRSGGRLLITGANGSGKSSLLAVIAGTLGTDRGVVTVAARRVGLLAQDVSFADPAKTAQQTFDGRFAMDGSNPTLSELDLLHPRELNTAVGELSVGQRRRLALALLIAGRPDLLLLDEPTNHISLALAAELEQALQAAVGTVLVASHDRWLRERWSDQVLALAGRR
ncbi:MAG: ATP-binding cassette domain-containing protein [Actinomycetota bacterium]|nr:ATP-binding cassette domain-containing protein [Actinomycetota bacterium]MDQ2955776.1 ATP-binding cassette domain-containing protein [Actinomycetota bacterium]